ncbi:MAG: 3-deoxy-7-phosphoheptulonate synthase [Bdellovibrionales bacterium]|nr:3-deoxy-7-phosphoheptulonate synthase [Bdellovibrionales bacterium]
MNGVRLHNLNIIDHKPLPSPAEIKELVPITDQQEEFVARSRQTICNILSGKDPRAFVLVGPCSIHDLDAAKEYANRLKVLATKVESSLYLVMRVYFEKPRTTVGWKGFINDPDLDDSFHIDKGLRLAREFLRYLAELELPAGTEALDPLTPQYLIDLIAWTAIGARTTESQTHREIASGLSSPVGFKNGTDGSIDVAVNALRSASQSHRFLGVNQDGRVSVYHTKGNSYGHVVLRGGKTPNYDSVSVAECAATLKAAGLSESIMVDCSHGNSKKDHSRQPLVFNDCISQIKQGRNKAGSSPIRGLMIESHLKGGRQDFPNESGILEYGQSITDACIDWETTEQLLRKAHEELQNQT